MRRIVIIVVVLVIVACVAIPVLAGLPGNVAGSPARQTVLRKATIDKGDLRLTVSATGSIVAKRQSPLAFDQPGRVQEVLVKEGQKVEAGQVLARLEDSTQQATLEQAQFALEAAQAALNKLLKPVDARDIKNAEADVKTAQANYSAIANAVTMETIKAYQTQYQQALVAAQDAEKIRIEAGGRFATDDPNYQKTLAAVGSAQMNAEIARLKLQQVENGHSLLSATASIAYYQARLAQVKAGPGQIQIDSAQTQLAIAQLQRDQAQHQLDKTRLVAPFAGIVTTVSIDPGEVSSSVAMILTDNSEMYTDVKVDESDIGKIAAGQTVELTLDALAEATLTGTVKRVAQLADANASVITYLVRITIDPTKAPVKIGMTANATFLVTQARDVTRVANVYLKTNRSLGQTTATLVNPDGTFTDVQVTVGVQGSDYSEVIDGLYEGETVALLANPSTK